MVVLIWTGTKERTGTMPATATKWTPPAPTIEKAHDVRRLSECTICHHLGIDLIRGLFKGSLVERGKHTWVHAYCLISSQEDGWDIFASLPSVEMGKITMSEWKALGIPYLRIIRWYASN